MDGIGASARNSPGSVGTTPCVPLCYYMRCSFGIQTQPCIETRLLDVSDVRDGLPYRSTSLKQSFGVRMPGRSTTWSFASLLLSFIDILESLLDKGSRSSTSSAANEQPKTGKEKKNKAKLAVAPSSWNSCRCFGVITKPCLACLVIRQRRMDLGRIWVCSSIGTDARRREEQQGE